ncbi:hypothetical protein [Actinokineospora pegani]|uniref:hypothetical protein n=1 Tax=Actinokineospora pegani TaxID=2654637 RepID=UPI0012E9E9B6|nr:hypothetical protein [Actinokineospora pegani]
MAIAAPPRPDQDQSIDTDAVSQFFDNHMPGAWGEETDGWRVPLGQRLDALSMPAGFGAEVNHRLGLVMLRPPILSTPAAGTWTFLTGPRMRLRDSTVADLALFGVTWAPAGSTILVPGPGAAPWVQAPAPGGELPGWGAVVGAARRACGGGW